MQGAQVQSLVGGLRFHTLHGAAKKLRKKKVGRDLENKFMAAGQSQGRGGRIVREFGMDMHTLLYLNG